MDQEGSRCWNVGADSAARARETTENAATEQLNLKKQHKNVCGRTAWSALGRNRMGALKRRKLSSNPFARAKSCITQLDFAHFRAPVLDGGPKDRRFSDETQGLFDR